MDFGVYYPKGLIEFGLLGNGGDNIGERISLDGLGAGLNGYLEFALGYSLQLTEKLQLGARLKLLNGYANITTQKSELGITTSPETFDLQFDGQYTWN